jgi:hypothetical protein
MTARVENPLVTPKRPFDTPWVQRGSRDDAVRIILAAPRSVFERLTAEPRNEGGFQHKILNVAIIYRGVEGNWFRALPRWENLARPLIEKELKLSH